MRHARTSVSSHDAHRWTTATGEAETREKRARAFPTRLPREKVYSGFLARSACWSTPLVSARPTTRVADMADDLRREPLRASNESFGIQALVGNGNDNVFVKGDPRVRRREPSRGVELHSARATNASSDAILPPPPPQASAPVGSPSASRETASVIRRSVDWNAESRDTAGLTMDERAFLAELASRRALVTDRARTTEVREALAAGARPMPVARPSTALPRRPSASESSENVPLDPSSTDVALRPAPGGASPAKRGARPRTAVPSSRSRASIASSLSAYARRRSVTFASPRDEHDDAVRLSAESIAAGAGVTSSPSSAQLRGSRTRSVGPGTSASADAQTSTNRRLRFSSPGGGGGVGLAAEPRPTDWRASLRGGYDGGPGAGANRAATTNAKSPARPDVPRGILRKSDDASATRVSMSADEEAFLVALAAERRMTTDRAKSAAKTSAETSAFASDPIAAQPGVEKPPSLGKAVHVSSPSPSRNRRTDAVVRAGWRPAPSPSRSRERPATAAARMSREHAENMWRHHLPDALQVSVVEDDAANALARAKAKSLGAPTSTVGARRPASASNPSPSETGGRSPARAPPPTRASWAGSFGRGVSVEGWSRALGFERPRPRRARRRRSGSGRGGGSGSGNRNWSAARAEAMRKRARASPTRRASSPSPAGRASRRRRRGGRRAVADEEGVEPVADEEGVEPVVNLVVVNLGVVEPRAEHPGPR